MTVPLQYASRDCPICGSGDFECLDRRIEDNLVATGTVEFEVSDGICRGCGFVYANPCPDQDSLDGYYTAKFLHSVGVTDYDMDYRLDHLARVGGDRRTVLEVGANEGSFVRKLAERGYDAAGLDLIEETARLGYGADGDGRRQVDLVVGSHVLEHIVDPGAFLRDCQDRLNPTGRVIFEVPNLHLYGAYSSAVFCEHVSHFSPALLAGLLRRSGFEVVDLEFGQPGRPIGFVVTAERVETAEGLTLPNEYEVNRAYFLTAASVLRERRETRRRMMRSIAAKAGEKAIAFWGANHFLIESLKEMPDDDTPEILVVDINDERWGQMVDPRFPIPICNPGILDGNDRVDTVVICALAAAKEIRGLLSRYGYDEPQILESP